MKPYLQAFVTVLSLINPGVRPALAVVLLFAAAGAASAQEEPYRVLVLHSFRNSLPANTDWHNGIARGFTSAPDLQIEIDIEAPDLSGFSDADYVTDLLEIYRRKYHSCRTHLSLEKDSPETRKVEPPDHGKIVEFPMAGGLHHRYRRLAA